MWQWWDVVRAELGAVDQWAAVFEGARAPQPFVPWRCLQARCLRVGPAPANSVMNGRCSAPQFGSMHLASSAVLYAPPPVAIGIVRYQGDLPLTADEGGAQAVMGMEKDDIVARTKELRAGGKVPEPLVAPPLRILFAGMILPVFRVTARNLAQPSCRSPRCPRCTPWMLWDRCPRSGSTWTGRTNSARLCGASRGNPPVPLALLALVVVVKSEKGDTEIYIERYI
jgi:hypothetical protein